MSTWFALAKPLLYRLSPETAHKLAVAALSARLLPPARVRRHVSLEVRALGKIFPSPIGLAAGFDKNAAAPDALLAQGFGFVETGTVTPKPQGGNPRPRIFRLVEDEAVINRLGFNNGGLDRFTANLARRNRNSGIVGANIGKNKDSGSAAHDYVQGLKSVYPYADYITVNISSPNTPGLRALQKKEALAELLQAICIARDACAREHRHRVPLLLKVAPDLGVQEMEDIAAVALDLALDGLIVSNTTIARPDSLRSEHRAETGGLSGRPLFAPSTEVLKQFYRLTGGKLLLVGAGGIASAEDAYAKIRAGATLVQLYTALVYQGFGLVTEIENGLAELLERDGFSHIGEAVGVDAT